jgi:hypothetical protein
MKRNDTIKKMFIAMLFIAIGLSSGKAFSQNKIETQVMKDCCMMKDGKMMQMKDGKLTKMKKKVIMADGTKCKPNGVCVMKDGTRIKMTEGNCIDNMGKIDDCAMSSKNQINDKKKMKS